MQRSIFISYRRSDSEGEAGRLSDVLAHRFTEQSVFMDVDAIRPGRDFRKAIEESIQNCAVLLVVIGPDWLDARNAAGERRLDESNDYVRLEISEALRRDIPVIPVLVRGARMPHADRLPADITDLAYRNSAELSHARWKSDLDILLGALEPCMRSAVPFSSPGGLPTPSVKTPSVPATTLDPAILQKVSALLARSIGPIAEVVVKRAARTCTCEAELTATVAGEIESPEERRHFLACFHA